MRVSTATSYKKVPLKHHPLSPFLASWYFLTFSGGVVAKSLGAIAVMYSSIHALASIQFDEDTEAKSMFAGTLTGALFKSTAGIKKCAAGGAFGFGLAALWAVFLKKDERVSYYV